MDRRSFLWRAGAACLCGACGGLASRSTLASEAAPHWTYEGHGGPADWGHLSPEYGACSIGKGQSPVDLSNAVAEALPHPKVAWKPVPLKVLNNGHTIEVAGAGGGTIEVDGAIYSLAQFHFHHRSEHTVDGKPFDLECHFVHKAVEPGGGLAVLGVLIAAGDANPAVERIFAIMPASAGETAANEPFDPTALLPKELATFRYSGSLTTPPCSEIVQWAVLKQPISASAEQIARFAALFPNNARPIQPLNGRKLFIEAT